MLYNQVSYNQAQVMYIQQVFPLWCYLTSSTQNQQMNKLIFKQEGSLAHKCIFLTNETLKINQFPSDTKFNANENILKKLWILSRIFKNSLYCF